MIINNKQVLTWDVESEGLDVDSDIISIATYDGEESKTYLGLEGLKEFMDFVQDNKTKYILVGYNTENYRGMSFDIPFIRTQCILNDIPYKLKYTESVDIFPLIQSFFNTTKKYIKYPSQSSLRKADLTKLAKANNIEYSTVSGTYDDLMELEEIDWLDYIEESHKEYNSLQQVYMMWYDREEKEEYISGADSLKLLQEGKLEDILRHNVNDVIRTYKLTEKVVEMVSDYDLQRATKIL